VKYNDVVKNLIEWKNGWMDGYEALEEEYWKRKGELLLDKHAQKLLSPPQIPHARLGIEVSSSLSETGE